MKTLKILVILEVFLTVQGCMLDTSGVDPPTDKLFYPTGLTMGGEDYLLAVNSNFDLTYNAGTLNIFDLKELDEKIEAAREYEKDCLEKEEDCLSDNDCGERDTGTEEEDGGPKDGGLSCKADCPRFEDCLLLSEIACAERDAGTEEKDGGPEDGELSCNVDCRSNEDCQLSREIACLEQRNACLKNCIDTTACDCLKTNDCQEESNEYLDKNHAFVIFPDSELIMEDETLRIGSFASDIEMTPRGNRALIPVRGERAVLIVDVKPNGDLYCGNVDGRECSDDHKITSNDNATMPIEPYEVASLEYRNKDSNEVTTLGFATHLAGGEVSLFKIDYNGQLAPELLDVENNVINGASGIAVRADPTDALKNEIYISGRNTSISHVAIMKVLTDRDAQAWDREPYFDSVSSISLAKDLYGATDARGIAVTSAGDRAYLVTRSPEALVALDTTSRELVDMTNLGRDPSVVVLIEDDNDTPNDRTDDKALYAVVLCFLSEQMYIVELDMMEVYVRATGLGPHSLTYDKKRNYLYVGNFRESTISIIEMTPPFDHAGIVIPDPNNPGARTKAKFKIGKPRLPRKHN